MAATLLGCLVLQCFKIYFKSQWYQHFYEQPLLQVNMEKTNSVSGFWHLTGNIRKISPAIIVSKGFLQAEAKLAEFILTRRNMWQFPHFIINDKGISAFFY